MIPYFEQPALHLGPIGIHAFGVLVALAVLLGVQLFARRAKREGLDPQVADGLVAYALVSGFVGAHLFSVLVYFPERLAGDPWLLLRFWENLSSFGGMAGGLIGIWMYLRFRRPVPAHERWGQLDAVAFVLPFAWAVGRLACTVASDHPRTHHQLLPRTEPRERRGAGAHRRCVPGRRSGRGPPAPIRAAAAGVPRPGLVRVPLPRRGPGACLRVARPQEASARLLGRGLSAPVRAGAVPAQLPPCGRRPLPGVDPGAMGRLGSPDRSRILGDPPPAAAV